MERRSFHDEIGRNRRSSILLIVILTLIVVVLAATISYTFAPEYLIVVLLLSLIFMLAYSYGSYMYGDQVVLSATKARPADEREHLFLRDTVEGLSLAAGVPAPKVYVVPSEEVNAFATGRDPEHASVAVTTGLMSVLDREEMEGVLAHELSHIRNRDVSFMTLVAVLVGLAAILSHVIRRTYRFRGVSRGRRGGRRDRERGAGIEATILALGFFLAIFAPLLTRMVQFAISRQREYLADASGVELTRYSGGLASALEKIMGHNRGEMDVSEAVSHLFFVDPNRSALDSLYATHPPIDERIKRLKAM
ncbi:MAG: M48 family metallopeptidase [Candidatus Bathyarchaeota archaeon]|nr:MAG: M48 family metallopeptidase [Candidatus Bathyarchaeota archaeon]